MGKRLGWVGAAVTVLYVLLWVAIVKERWGAFGDLPLNAIGDFLAGAFAPLAFLWLVLGFIQQGFELRQNSEALRMQAEELKNSVEQQKALVKVSLDQHFVEREAFQLTRTQFEEERAAKRRAQRPIFAFSIAAEHARRDGGRVYEIRLENSGPPCREVRIDSIKGDIAFDPNYFAVVGTNAAKVTKLAVPPDVAVQKVLGIRYLDGNDERGRATVEVRIHQSSSLEILRPKDAGPWQPGSTSES